MKKCMIFASFLLLIVTSTSFAASEIVLCSGPSGSYPGPDTKLTCIGMESASLAELYKKGFKIVQAFDLGLQVNQGVQFYLSK